MIIRPNFNIGMRGFFRFQTINKFSGKITSDTGWFPNTILDAGRNVMATEANWLTWCQVGTDGTFPPTLAQRQAETTLGAWHAGTNVIVTESSGQNGTPPYYGWKRKTWRFNAGTVATNLSEAGVGWGVGGGGQPDTLISRAPILDPVSFLPTTVTPLADEMLDVSYEMRYYPPLVDVLGPQVTLDGVIYDTITRASGVTGGNWSQDIGLKIGWYRFDNNSWYVADGDLGTLLTGPSGLTAGSPNATYFNSAYVNNSYEVSINIGVGALAWNLVAGIRSVRISTTAGNYQTQFNGPADARIPKTSSYQMDMGWLVSWAELPPDWAAGTYEMGDRVTHALVQWESDINSNTSEPGVANWTQV